MLAHSSNKLKDSIMWVLVANGEHAQIYRYHKNNDDKPVRSKHDHSVPNKRIFHELVMVPGMDLKATSANIYDLHHHDQGNFVGGLTNVHNTSEPRFDVHEDIRQSLVTLVVNKLKHARLNEFFHRLVLVAPPRVLSALKKQLHTTVLDYLIAEVPKDYTHDIHDALLKHLQLTFEDNRIV